MPIAVFLKNGEVEDGVRTEELRMVSSKNVSMVAITSA